ncbi:MAG TPA: 1-(5-phosphoribosyl)-5-[(5-phosphoribosylamino)methylideneamino]imidazole-4-carboxamide isomerase [Alphaproteobacteria bacterium]|nr:1-(5-phosphoribosyl)-5-[(5-phosphoribosylamino)methylideneamino]imidazole-4-carboxamide isomerase [Alphaproteobacteria bacterium]
MILYPAIDLKGGQCVRLVQGDMDRVTIYNPDPVAQARTWESAGFSWIHIVDLDGAVGGAPANAHAVRNILAQVRIPIQLGGGIRTRAQVEHWLKAGVSRVILGTAAVRDPDMVRASCAAFPGRIVLGLDTRGAYVAVDGWTELSDLPAVDLAREMEKAGVSAIIHTDIARDGTGNGPNLVETRALARAVGIPVIASGGVGSLEDLRAVRAASADGVSGVILGRALYDGRITPAQALAIAGE